MQGRLTIGPARLLEELFYRLEEAPSWNPTLVECRTVQPIDQYTDISYQVGQHLGSTSPPLTGQT